MKAEVKFDSSMFAAAEEVSDYNCTKEMGLVPRQVTVSVRCHDHYIGLARHQLSNTTKRCVFFVV